MNNKTLEQSFYEDVQFKNQYFAKFAKIRFLLFFHLEYFAEYRQNNEYKNFITVYFLKWKIAHILTRTGNNTKTFNSFIPSVYRYGKCITDSYKVKESTKNVKIGDRSKITRSLIGNGCRSEIYFED